MSLSGAYITLSKRDMTKDDVDVNGLQRSSCLASALNSDGEISIDNWLADNEFLKQLHKTTIILSNNS